MNEYNIKKVAIIGAGRLDSRHLQRYEKILNYLINISQ